MASTRSGGKRTGVTYGTTTTKPKTAGVTKKRAPATHKKKSTVTEKIEGVGDKIEGAVLHKPGKKAAGTKKIRGTAGTKKKVVGTKKKVI